MPERFTELLVDPLSDSLAVDEPQHPPGYRFALDPLRQEERSAHVGGVGAGGVDVGNGDTMRLGQRPHGRLGGDRVQLDLAGGQDGGHQAERRVAVVGGEPDVGAPGSR